MNFDRDKLRRVAEESRQRQKEEELERQELHRKYVESQQRYDKYVSERDRKKYETTISSIQQRAEEAAKKGENSFEVMVDEIRLDKNKKLIYEGIFSRRISPLNLSEMGQRVYRYCKEQNLNPKLKDEAYDPYREQQEWNRTRGPGVQKKFDYRMDQYDYYRIHIFIEW